MATLSGEASFSVKGKSVMRTGSPGAGPSRAVAAEELMHHAVDAGDVNTRSRRVAAGVESVTVEPCPSLRRRQTILPVAVRSELSHPASFERALASCTPDPERIRAEWVSIRDGSERKPPHRLCKRWTLPTVNMRSAEIESARAPYRTRRSASSFAKRRTKHRSRSPAKTQAAVRSSLLLQRVRGEVIAFIGAVDPSIDYDRTLPVNRADIDASGL